MLDPSRTTSLWAAHGAGFRPSCTGCATPWVTRLDSFATAGQKTALSIFIRKGTASRTSSQSSNTQEDSPQDMTKRQPTSSHSHNWLSSKFGSNSNLQTRPRPATGHSWTAFQQRVWKALQQIPVGATVNDTEVARQIGLPKAVRAVTQACGANKLALAIASSAPMEPFPATVGAWSANAVCWSGKPSAKIRLCLHIMERARKADF